jgi:hypothetical protein
MTLEPEPGVPGDRRLLDVLVKNGWRVEPVAGTAKMRLGMTGVKAGSAAEAAARVAEGIRALLPASGYRLSEPEPVSGDADGTPLPEAAVAR